MSYNANMYTRRCSTVWDIYFVIVPITLQVSLGQTNDLLAADYSADKLPKGKHSTRGLGRVEPDPVQNHTL